LDLLKLILVGDPEYVDIALVLATDDGVAIDLCNTEDVALGFNPVEDFKALGVN
jgi:hypothetical protein